MKAKRSAAVEKDITRAEQQDDLVQRRIYPDVNEPERMRSDRDAGEEKYRDIGNPYFLRQQAADGADRQDETAGQQRVPGDLKGAWSVQWACFLCDADDSRVVLADYGVRSKPASAPIRHADRGSTVDGFGGRRGFWRARISRTIGLSRCGDR